MHQATLFKRAARKAKWNMCWTSKKITLGLITAAILIVVLAVVYIST